MEQEFETIIVNGKKYVPQDSVDNKQLAVNIDGLPYVIIRAYQSSPFAGYLQKREGREVTLLKARRLWYWEGGASLSQLASTGTSKPDKCKFPAPVEKVEILDVLEVLYCTQTAQVSLSGVKRWEA